MTNYKYTNLDVPEIFEVLDLHQVEAVKRALEYNKGQLVQPTGSGKTREAAHITYLELLNGFKVIVVKSPRIVLTNQIAMEFTQHIKKCAKTLEYQKLIIHSGDIKEFDNEESLSIKDILSEMKDMNALSCTSSTKELETKLKRAKQKNIPFIIYTTYHSNEKVIDLLNRLKMTIDLDINDESHNLVRTDFYYLVEMSSHAKRQYFFTATQKFTNSNEGFGQNNESRFGKRIYELSYREALKLGIVLPVKAKSVKCNVPILNKEDFDSNVSDIIRDAYHDLESEVNSYFGAKMLVAADGQGHISSFLNSEDIIQLISEGVDIFTIHSEEKLITINGEIVKRKDFFKIMRKTSADRTKKMILIHHDILSEGVDIQGLHGVLILRNMELSKFYQTVGRVLRVFRENRNLKTHGIVMFPDLDANPEIMSNFSNLLRDLIQEGYVPYQEIEFIFPPISPNNRPPVSLIEESSLFSSDNTVYSFYTQSLDFNEQYNEISDYFTSLVTKYNEVA